MKYVARLHLLNILHSAPIVSGKPFKALKAQDNVDIALVLTRLVWYNYPLSCPIKCMNEIASVLQLPYNATQANYDGDSTDALKRIHKRDILDRYCWDTLALDPRLTRTIDDIRLVHMCGDLCRTISHYEGGTLNEQIAL